MSPSDYQILLEENNAFKNARWAAKRSRDRIFMGLLVGGVGSFFFMLLGFPMYDMLRADHEVSRWWCGRYRSLPAWERETERGHVEVEIDPGRVVAYTVLEGELRAEVEVRITRALNDPQQLRCWSSALDDKPCLTLCELTPGVWRVLVHRPESVDPEIDWVPVERVR